MDADDFDMTTLDEYQEIADIHLTARQIVGHLRSFSPDSRYEIMRLVLVLLPALRDRLGMTK